jgi:iron-sulfur cluster assembly accessory protein
MSKNILTFCAKTISHFRGILKKSNSKSILVGVKGGGCNGLKYYVEPTNDPPNKLDETIKVDDVNIIVCGKSLFHLIGTEVKWKDDLMGSGIEFSNPNATSSCGCGETFSI